MKDDLEQAHKHSSWHAGEIQRSKKAGCFHCLKVFSPTEITEWIDENAHKIGQTALCPYCDVDAVIGDESKFPLTIEFLTTMNKYWFN